MISDDCQLIDAFCKSKTPEETSDLFLKMGFSGLVFKRWYPDVMDNWEGHLAKGFFEHYYAAQLYKWCPVALAIHNWSRDYTFTEARKEFLVGDEKARRVESVWRQFGINDGIVMFTGENKIRSSVVIMSNKPVGEKFTRLGGVLAYAARRLASQLPPGHELLSQMSREDPDMSAMQNKILQLQIDRPDLSNIEMAQRLGMSPKTLHSHHKKIAKKTGVTTFAGAVIKRMKEAPTA